jgi:hypothetical protein
MNEKQYGLLLAQEINKLRAELTELRKDKERLDWLERNCRGSLTFGSDPGNCTGTVNRAGIDLLMRMTGLATAAQAGEDAGGTTYERFKELWKKFVPSSVSTGEPSPLTDALIAASNGDFTAFEEIQKRLDATAAQAGKGP